MTAGDFSFPVFGFLASLGVFVLVLLAIVLTVHLVEATEKERRKSMESA